MQTKKRAKSVKFGKKTQEEAKKQDIKEEVIETKKLDRAELKEGELKKEIPAQEEIDSAQEIKQKIAEKISSKEEDEKYAEQASQGINFTDKSETPQVDEALQTSENSFGSFSKNFEEPQKKNNWLFFIIVVLITFVIGIFAIAGFYYFSDKSETSPSPMPKASISPSIEPSPTSTEVDLAEFTIEVLNGSGVSGVAAKVKTQLTDAGFTVGSIGNADKSDYTETVIAAKKSVSELFISKLRDELKKKYIIEEKIETLADSSETDVVVTVGSSSAE